MNKNRKDKIRDLILIAVITSALTALSSFLLTKSQLSKEQEYWKERLKKERLLELQDRQISLLEDINTSILELEVLSKEIKILTSEFNIHMAILKRGGNDYSEKNNLFNNKLVDYHKKLYSLSSKLQMTTIYFENIDSLITPLSKSLENNYKNNRIVGEDVDLNNIPSYFNKDYSTIKELTDCRIKLLEKMMKDITIVKAQVFDEKKK